MKKPLLVLFLAMLGCSFPMQISLETPAPSATPISTPTLIPTPYTVFPPGTEKNPLILALAPSTHPSQETLTAGDKITAFIEAHTGYKLVTVVPSSEDELVDAFQKSNAHIAALSPFGYILARKDETVTAILASIRNKQTLYGAQFIANRESGFISYYDPIKNQNTVDAKEALKQFADKKPCWSDPTSPSGYVVPLGLLTQAGVNPRSGAFLEGQPSVVRAVYARNICDFGATFIDARQSPTLEADYADVMDRVIVIWRAPDVIPYENISISTSLPIDMRRVIQRAFIDLMLTPDGKSAMQTVYGIDELQIVEDSAYQDFENIVASSKLDLSELVKESQP